MSVTGDTSAIRFRRVSVAGRPDFEHQIMLTHRGNNGAPGLDIITPVRVPGQDSAILVNRGWIYSPDGMTADLSRWHEPDTTFMGYIDTFERAGEADSVRGGAIRWMSHTAIARAIPYPVRSFYVVALGEVALDSARGAAPRIVRLQAPKLGEGNHLSYALQWFGFAMISVIGASIVTARSMHSRRSS
jgi:surfeit locus 1 family protein